MGEWKFEDARPLTERERRHLCWMLGRALIEIRLFGLTGEARRAAAVADAFHNVPLHLWQDNFSFGYFRDCLESYRRKYPGSGFDYPAMLDQLLREEGGRA